MTNHSVDESEGLWKTIQQTKRKEYTKPVLTEFGHIQNLTKGGSGIRADAGSAKKWVVT